MPTEPRLQAARERGRKGGRRPKLTPDQRSEIIGMLKEGRPAAEIARLFRVHRATVGRHRRRGQNSRSLNVLSVGRFRSDVRTGPIR
ncbi:helix-turn-helix domain-containing protein [Mesorhizobium sp. M0520]|uniref:helix-turn-helix domain-containing protein n=1 Tax=Mesorhizobium sp. M0520 TaxID=2956957 RepID=UPI00333BB0E0